MIRVILLYTCCEERLGKRKDDFIVAVTEIEMGKAHVKFNISFQVVSSEKSSKMKILLSLLHGIENTHQKIANTLR